MQFKTGVLTFALVAFLGSQSVFADELVTNGGFESGNFTGFTLLGPTTTTGNPGNFYGVDSYDAASGNYGAYLSTLAGTRLTLAQQATVQAGHNYTLTFSLAQNEAPTSGFPNSFEVTLGGAVLFDETNIAATGPDNLAPVFKNFSYSFTTASNAASLEAFDIIVENDNGLFSLDKVSISTTATPEPATLLLIVPALGLLAIRRVKTSL